jgi:Rnl2 family RNA ligase
MAHFVKYPSIENHYSTKNLEWFLEKYPKLRDEKYVMQEKIHGANIQFIFTPKEPYVVASRNNKSEDEFYGYKKIIEDSEKLKALLANLQKYADEHKSYINLYGEIFGPSIQKGIYYGDEKQIKFFDLKIDGQWITPSALHDFIPKDLCVPTISFADSLQDALEFNAERNSLIAHVENNVMEGIVIKPFNTLYLDGHGHPFYVKKKNEKFKEVARIKKIRPKKEEIPEILALREIFESYINENRMDNIESKNGKLNDEKEIGKYLGLLMKDAYDDFYKDNAKEFLRVCDIYTSAKKEICKTSKNAINIIKNRLAGK